MELLIFILAFAFALGIIVARWWLGDYPCGLCGGDPLYPWDCPVCGGKGRL